MADRASHQLPILSQISIPTPCPASWDEMTGDEISRHCDQCEKKVFHLSNMTAEEAERVVVEHAGNLCARIRVRKSDGSVVTQSTQVRRHWLARLMRRSLAAVAAVPLALFAAGCSRDGMPGPIAEWMGPEDEEAVVVTGIVAPEEEVQGGIELMGDVVVVPDPDEASSEACDPPAEDPDGSAHPEEEAPE